MVVIARHGGVVGVGMEVEYVGVKEVRSGLGPVIPSQVLAEHLRSALVISRGVMRREISPSLYGGVVPLLIKPGVICVSAATAGKNFCRRKNDD